VLDDGDVVDRCRRELSASVTRRALDSAGGKKIGKGGCSNGGGGAALGSKQRRQRHDCDGAGWAATHVALKGRKERER
jgi:hypothetical protein